jgi:hypothetical protein
VAVVWGYQHFPDGTDERAALDRILSEARARGLTFLSDQDARPAGSAHPEAHLWDNGTDAVAELDRVLRVRRVALDRFGETAIRRGVPLALLEETLVPLYLHHRYQVEAAVKVLGGMSYTYAFRGDGQTPTAPVPAADQQRALQAVLATLRPDVLALPRPLLPLIPPRPSGYPPHRELFQRRTGLVFDAIEPAVAASDLSAGLLFDPVRAARLVQQHALDPALPGLDAVLTQVTRTVFDQADPRDGYHAEIARAVQRVVAERLMTLALDAPTAQVRALTEQALDELRGRLVAAPGMGTAARAHRRLLAADIGRFLDRQFMPERRPPLPALPPGAPIGDRGHD